MQTTFTNAQLVLRDEVETGTLQVKDGIIAEVGSSGTAVAGALDCEGDYLIPGLVDIHTDNIEIHMFPRSGVVWPAPLQAFLMHDYQMAASGITTTLDSLSLGDYDERGKRAKIFGDILDALDFANDNDLLRSEHFLHFRCELSDHRFAEIVEPLRGNKRLKLVSVMDHTPGQGQWRDLAIFRETRRKRKGLTWTDEGFETYLAECRERQERFVPANKALALDIAKQASVAVASHDDTTVEDVSRGLADGFTISEFPTTVEAARAAHDAGMHVVMGSPNVVLKKSHSGNVSALALAEHGLLDALASDYVPSSFVQAAFELSAFLSLPDAIARVTRIPAQAVGMHDRGEIAAGLRADLVRVRLTDRGPVVRNVWRKGMQIV
jgi:alpha-D-ribose 1-methylphosphonate 5-triphosphate diphosphatase